MNPLQTVPETWSVTVHDASVASLQIPGLLSRDRTFDIDVQLRVRVPTDAAGSQFSLSLEIDGSQQWSRTVPGLTPGEVDTLDYHCRVRIEAGRQMRLRARAQARRCHPVSIELSATEAVAAV